MKTRKRVLALALSACMILSAAPTAFAENTQSISQNVNVSIVDSGTCGDNLTWMLDSEGTLTISGTGKMTEWSSLSDVPWYSNRTAITSVVIGKGVTSIAHDAFYYCDSLTSVAIPNSVISIGSVAFMNCRSLTSVTIPAGVTSIGDNAFAGSGIYDILVPETVTSIGDEAFNPYLTIRGKKGSAAEKYALEYIATFFYDIDTGEHYTGGECGENGDNLIWRLSHDGVLDIEGTGVMFDYATGVDFADGGKVSGWAKNAVLWAVQKGIINGSVSGGTVYLNPQGNATRAEAAAIFKNYLEE